MLKGDRLGVTRDLGRTLTYHIMKEVGSGIVAAEKIEWNDQYALSMLESGSFLVAPIIAQRLANKSHQYDNLCNFLHDKKVIPIRGDYLESSRVLLIKKDTIKIKIQRFTDNRTADGQHFISTSFIIYNPNELREYFIKPEDTTL